MVKTDAVIAERRKYGVLNKKLLTSKSGDEMASIFSLYILKYKIIITANDAIS